ncbi:MAG TPA: hypothetical protein VLF59_02435 [Candidatus Saccharimonadales bacterium]|nr:hypothetical protein [Candidatus Saccharimonadales bacterium]
MSHIIGSIITDCADDNARARQELRFASLFGVRPAFHGVTSAAPDIEAAGNLLDQLQVLNDLPKSHEAVQPVMLLNVAPRGEAVKKQWPNGTPFCYVKIGNVLVVSTYAGRGLSLAKKHGLMDEVQVMDIPTVTAAAVGWGELTAEEAERINTTQFRSLEFLPLAAYWLSQGRDVPARTTALEQHDVEGKVWAIDNFGNIKTTWTADELGFDDGKEFILADGQKVVCHHRLADVPADMSALTLGSSGYGKDRFVELVVQWKDGGFYGSNTAADRHTFIVGDNILKP